MGNASDLLVRLLVDDSDLNKVDGAGTRFEKFGSGLDKAAVGATAVLGDLAAGAVVAGNAAVDAAKSQAQLQYALDQFPATADTTADKLGEINAAIARKTGIDDDSIAVGQSVLAQYGLTGAQLEKMTPLLVDYAAKTGQDLPAAAEALGKGLMGQGRALKAIGIDMTDAGSVAGNYDQIMAGLTTQVGGYADTMGETAEGKQAIFLDQLGELQESLGTILLPIITDVSGALADFAGWAAENSDLVAGLAATAGALAGAVLLVNGAYKGMMLIQGIASIFGLMRGATVASTAATTANTTATWANNVAWLASPVTWIILAIIVAVGLLIAAGIWLVQNWDGVVKWFGEAWQNVSLVFSTGLQAIGQMLADWSGLSIIIDNWGAISKWFEDFWQNIQTGAATAVDWVVDKLAGIGRFFYEIPGTIGNAVKGLGDGLLGIVRTVASTIAWLWNNSLGRISFDVPGWVPFIGGQHFQFPQIIIPALAEGGIVTSATLALIGEAGPEAVVPLSRGGEFGLGGSGGGDGSPTQITLQLDGRTFYEAMVRHDRKRR